MKKTLFIIILFCASYNVQSQPSLFEKDGKIWVSYDPKTAQEQHFHPVENDYQCHGNFMNIITDTVKTNGIYRIFFGTRWVEVKDIQEVDFWGETQTLADHIMFQVMVACVDDHFIYCQCTKKFPIIRKSLNFKP